MSDQLRKELDMTVQCYNTLQHNFQNNLRVIEEQEQEIELLSTEISRLRDDCYTLKTHLNHKEQQFENEITVTQQRCRQQLSEKDQQMQELTMMMETRMRREIEKLQGRLNQEVKGLKSQLLEREEVNRRLMGENSRHGQTIKQQKSLLLQYESRMELLTDEKNACANKMALHLQELQGVRSSNCEWEQMLKSKLKQSQKQRQNLEEELSEIKLAVKEKLKKQKQEHHKKLLHFAEEKENQFREMIQEQKELRYKLQKSQSEQREAVKDLQKMKEERDRLQVQLAKCKQNELKSNFEKNQKEYDYFLKIFEQDKKDMKNQIDLVMQQKKALKEEIDEINGRRQNLQKYLEKSKSELVHRAKELDECKKQNRRLRQELENRANNLEFNALQTNKETALNINNRGFDSIKMDYDYSKVYTEDMGIIDDKFFGMGEESLKSPTNLRINTTAIANRQAQYMKKVGELQLQNQQMKNLVKRLREETEGIRNAYEDKNKEITSFRDKANSYWQRANDKEQQVMMLREQNGDLKANIAELQIQIRQFKEGEAQQKQKVFEQQQMKEKIVQLELQIKDLKNQIKLIENQRNTLQEISSQLRAELNSLKEYLNSEREDENQSIEASKYNQTEPYPQGLITEMRPQREETRQNYELTSNDRPKMPKKLHDLVRERKMLAVSGKKAAIEDRVQQVRLEHIGTTSQKQIYEKIKIKNKTPPKVANYAELKEKQRRTRLLETASQKQVLQRLRSRQGVSNSPDHYGVNYLQLRDQNSPH